MRSNCHIARAAQASMRVQKGERASLTRREMPSRGLCGDAMPGTRYSSHVHTLCNAWRGKILRNRDSLHPSSNCHVALAAQASTRVQTGERASLTRRQLPSRGLSGDTMPGTRYISHVYTLCNAWRGKILRNRGHSHAASPTPVIVAYRRHPFGCNALVGPVCQPAGMRHQLDVFSMRQH